MIITGSSNYRYVL